jgi:hypothetical protein
MLLLLPERFKTTAQSALLIIETATPWQGAARATPFATAGKKSRSSPNNKNAR